jgi:flavin-dependent dehydrogenase
MPRMRAPDGVVSFSHGGHSFEIAEDGIVEVDEHVARELASHGFVDVDSSAPSEAFMVRRELVVDTLAALGVSVSAEMRADRLVEALEKAVDGKGGKTKGGKTKPADPPAA